MTSLDLRQLATSPANGYGQQKQMDQKLGDELRARCVSVGILAGPKNAKTTTQGSRFWSRSSPFQSNALVGAPVVLTCTTCKIQVEDTSITLRSGSAKPSLKPINSQVQNKQFRVLEGGKERSGPRSGMLATPGGEKRTKLEASQ